MQLSCHSVAVVLTLVQTKQIIINIHERNNTEKYKQYKTEHIQVHILPNTHTYTHPHITIQVKTTTVQDTPK